MAGMVIMWGRGSVIEGITPTAVVRAASEEEPEREPHLEVWRDSAYKGVKTASERNNGQGQTHY